MKELPRRIYETIIIRRLARAIETAYDNGALTILAGQLKSQLKNLSRDNQVTTGQLEKLILETAKSITNQGPPAD